MLQAGQPIPGDADLVILPGTKSTRADLDFLRAQGWHIDLAAHHRRGGRILGICGGYQMLGSVIKDPDGIEGDAGQTKGLGFLDIETTMGGDKRLALTHARHVHSGTSITGYEIHIGQSDGPDTERPFARVGQRPEGATSPDGRIMGTYLHGMFSHDAFRKAFLSSLGVSASDHSYEAGIENILDQLAEHLETHLDVPALFRLGS